MRFLLLFIFAATLHAAPPNIVLIFCDDLGYADIGAFGAQGYATPHLDRLAREGRKFTRFYVSSAVCSASRAALLTGCYHSRVGIHGALGPRAKIGLNPSETTLAEVLKTKGYATGLVGKWHLGDAPGFLPGRHGFDEWLGLPYSNDMWPHHPEARPGTYPKLPLYDGDRVIDEEVTPDDQATHPRRYAERCVSFIQRNAGKPFFLYFAPNMPHVPLYAGEAFRGKTARGLYGDVVAEIDWSVGEILRALDEAKLAENTLIIFTSDNGPWLSYGEHAGRVGPLREGKGTSWEGGIRVPFLARWPGHIPADSTTDEPAMTIDLLPTLAGLAGADLPTAKIDGHDILPLFTGEGTAALRRYAIYYGQNELQAAIEGRWKLVLPHSYRTLGEQPLATGGRPGKYRSVKLAAPALYDLVADPGEQHNLLGTQPAEAERLLAFVEEMRAELGDALTQRPGSANRAPGRLAQP
jgi:arylsulfatase A-like enzyme